MSNKSPNDVTRILHAMERGEEGALDELLPLLYDELRLLAVQKLSREAPGQTLQATALVHEVFLRLTGGNSQSWSDVKTGKVLWEHEFDQGFCSSPILVNDRVYMIDLSGMMQIFKMDDEFQLLGASNLGEPAYATPAFLGDRIFVRSLDHLFCIGAKTQ